MMTLRSAPLAVLAISTALAAPQFGGILDKLSGKKGASTVSLSDGKIVSGLKEALQIGATNAVALTRKTDGFMAIERSRFSCLKAPPRRERTASDRPWAESG